MGITLTLSLDDAVILAISQGAKSAKDIAQILNVDENEVEKTIEKLKALGYIVEKEEGFWIFKHRAYYLTKKGFEKAEELKQKLEEIAKSIMDKVKEGEIKSREDLYALYPGIDYLIPLLLMFNLLDLSLLPFLALGLSEPEQDMTEDVSAGDVDLDEADEYYEDFDGVEL